MNQEIIEKTKNNIEKFLRESEEHQDKSIEYILINPETNDTRTLASNGNDEAIEFTPFSGDMGFIYVPEWDFNFDYYVYNLLEENYKIGYMSDNTHYGIWCSINELYTEDIDYKEGVQSYLKYCIDNNITKEYLKEKTGLEVADIMNFYEPNHIVIEDNKVYMSKNMYKKENELSYLRFVLGYDYLHDMMMKSELNECDVSYDFCDYIARKFINSEEYTNNKHSTYEMLGTWLEENKNFIEQEYKKHIRTEEKTYNGNLKIMEQGYRNKEPIALIEKDVGNDKEYIVAFYFKPDGDKLSWSYAYYYNDDKEKAQTDYKKVINGGNLSNTFEKKNKENER